MDNGSPKAQAPFSALGMGVFAEDNPQSWVNWWVQKVELPKHKDHSSQVNHFPTFRMVLFDEQPVGPPLLPPDGWIQSVL